MGVTGLWQILHPCARPIKLETLNRKRLAVDASIWIYQFLKAVRDKDGNALRNSHVVGFFRRICKLLFFGIKPVFVFDGGAPTLKRQTVSDRRKRREGRRDDAVRTAGKLLAVQMQRRAEEDEARRKNDRVRIAGVDEAPVPENLVYADENLMGQQERQQNRRFRKKDAYHLPDLDVSMNEMGGPNDPRVMSLEELQTYAKQFEAGEDINVYDFSKIDYDSPFFTSLPASDRYNILNAARLRSRLRMGHSKEQLDSMFPDRMAFSRFQIERVQERNELTQRLMHINEGGDALFDGSGRIAGEKGREYVLVKNDGVEGGWALGVISDEGMKQETAIDIDAPEPNIKVDDQDLADEDDFEDVPIEGLNRLPKLPKPITGQQSSRRRGQGPNRSRKLRSANQPTTAESDSLFVAEDSDLDKMDEGTEDGGDNTIMFGEDIADAGENEELQRAIAMSLESGTQDPSRTANSDALLQEDDEEDDMLEVFKQTVVPEALPVPKGSGRAIANVVNKRAFDAAPDSREVTSFGVPAPISDDESLHEDDAMDLQAALAQSRQTKSERTWVPVVSEKAKDSTTQVAKQAGFSGPLPFEKLDLGSSLLGKKKMQERTAEIAGGFENSEMTEAKTRPAEPLPPWFEGSLKEDLQKQRALEDEDRERARKFNTQFQFQSKDGPTLRRHETDEVIDLEAEDDNSGFKATLQGEVINLESPELKDDGFNGQAQEHTLEDHIGVTPNEMWRESPNPTEPRLTHVPFRGTKVTAPFQDDDDAHEGDENEEYVSDEVFGPTRKDESRRAIADEQVERDEETMLWSESGGEGHENGESYHGGLSPQEAAIDVARHTGSSRSPSSEFEDVEIPDKSDANTSVPTPGVADNKVDATTMPTFEHQDSYVEDEQAEFDDFSDPEEEEMLRQLTLEAEEHARFASTLNHKTQAENIADYEKELKQLRNQQKKDRRDADEVTHIMIQECQQLLRLFGLPYVTAPMEAEAQCAELVRLGLVDGIVTDDSDCFLFGGTRVYKNMFNQAKFVECYLTTDLEKEFDLTRDKLIQVAHLLGSDYTEGLPGVGPVTALEILGEFSTLQEFRSWWNAVQMNLIPKSEDAGKPFRKKFRKNAAKLFLPTSFPDMRVDKAYQDPEVDSDPQPFQWGVPDLDALRSFLMATIGWSQERTDEVLVPVIKDMNRRVDEGTQSNITAFFDGGVGIGAAGSKGNGRGEAFAPRKRVAESSRRMGSALTRMAERANVLREHTRDESRGSEDNAPGAADEFANGAAGANDNIGDSTDRPRLPPSNGADDSSETELPRKKRRKGSRKASTRAKRSHL